MRPFHWAGLALLALAPLVTGCSTPFARTAVAPPPGWIYQNTRAPLSVDYNNTAVNPGKEGIATVTYICGWPLIPNSSFALDSTAIKTAAENGGITNVAYADYETYNVLGVYARFTVHAYGD